MRSGGWRCSSLRLCLRRHRLQQRRISDCTCNATALRTVPALPAVPCAAARGRGRLAGAALTSLLMKQYRTLTRKPCREEAQKLNQEWGQDGRHPLSELGHSPGPKPPRLPTPRPLQSPSPWPLFALPGLLSNKGVNRGRQR